MPICRSSKKKCKAGTEVQLEVEEKKVEPKPVEVQLEVEKSGKPQATKKSQEEGEEDDSKLKSAAKISVEVEKIKLKLIESEDFNVNNMQSTSSVCSNSANSVEFLEMLRILEANRSVTVEQFAKIIPDYDGITVPIRTWLENFNENASAYDLTEKQKYVNARNKMRGTAKLFLETVSVSNYEALREALVEEFDVILSSADVHQKLIQRKKRNEENFHEYVLQMRKLAALGTVEDESVIRYIVDGLKVRDDLKYPLYSAKTFKELRDRFEVIQQMSGNQINNLVEQKQNYAKPAQKGRDVGSELRGVSKQHCFNCGSTSHARSQCEAERKCFKCNGSGHIAKNCDKSNGKRTVSIITNDKRNKRMQINNKYFSCLIDTGVYDTVYEKHFSNLELSKSSAKLYGLGNVTTTVKGALKAEVLVDKIKSDHTFLVIADSNISSEVIVGYDFIQQFQLEFNSDGYFFSEKIDQKHDGTFQCVYNVVESGHEIDVAPQYREVVMKLINNYKPVANPAVHPIQLRIVTKGNLLNFNESPTRMSGAERGVVKKQIEEWLEKGIVRESTANIASKVVAKSSRHSLRKGVYMNLLGHHLVSATHLRCSFARPLTQLLKKDAAFVMGVTEQQAVQKLKAALTQDPVLKIFKQNGKTQLHVDASKHGFGATLVQQHESKWHPVFYWSRKTSPQEEKYLATKRLRHYLMGIRFDLITDCAAFKQTAAKKDVPREVVQWLMYLQDFDFNIEHRSADRMEHVDNLSRYPVIVIESHIKAKRSKMMNI
ncbi:uncharacterized protein LOC129250517 [Anastrepha obliqua]|uniref:uncharacterized protein LOC129250517 n=1 Tax=Anastrepha obliqua TaxID=95512 RepID=UPI00240A59CC|nr:uncharacterized protein LOC129250517 [Anastrepha obliqua]